MHEQSQEECKMVRGWTQSEQSVALSFVLLWAAGCSNAPAKPLTFAWITKNTTTLVFAPGTDGAKAQAAQLTTTKNRQVTIVDLSPTPANGQSEADAQVMAMQNAIAMKVDGISMSVTDPVKIGPLIDQAVGMGIEVITWDSDAPSSKRFTNVAVDNAAVGRAAAHIMNKLLEGQATKKVGIWTTGTSATDTVSPNVGLRVDAFRSEAATLGITALAPLQCLNSVMPRSVCAMQVDNVDNMNPDLDGWFFPSVWLKNIAAVDWNDPSRDMSATPMTWQTGAANGTIKTVAVDDPAQALTLIDINYIQAMIGQKSWGWGFDSINYLYQRVVEKMSFPPFQDTGFDVICKDNVAQMRQVWNSNNFALKLTPCANLPTQ
jgi:ribose transport system substrate-binding protein